MALIVEDGTIVANADSYFELSEATTYHDARGNSAWAAATEGEQEAAAREATAWLDARFKSMWQGRRVDGDQPLDWPRYGVVTPDGFHVDSDEIPRDLKHAAMEAALRALSADLDPDLSRGGNVKRQKLGPMEIEYMDTADPSTRYPRIIRLVRWLLESGGGEAQIKLERA